jgi:ATP-dependent DNA ligase
MPRVESRVVYLPHVERRGIDLFAAVCERDLEGIVAKWKRGPYLSDGVVTNWLKIKNLNYSQMAGRRELFERRQGGSRRSSRPAHLPRCSRYRTRFAAADLPAVAT